MRSWKPNRSSDVVPSWSKPRDHARAPSRARTTWAKRRTSVPLRWALPSTRGDARQPAGRPNVDVALAGLEPRQPGRHLARRHASVDVDHEVGEAEAEGVVLRGAAFGGTCRRSPLRVAASAGSAR